MWKHWSLGGQWPGVYTKSHPGPSPMEQYHSRGHPGGVHSHHWWSYLGILWRIKIPELHSRPRGNPGTYNWKLKLSPLNDRNKRRTQVFRMTDLFGVPQRKNKPKTLTSHPGEHPDLQRWREKPEILKGRKALSSMGQWSDSLWGRMLFTYTPRQHTYISANNISCKTVKLRICLNQVKREFRENRKGVQEIQGKMETKPRGE